jgi:hypothetical protein
LNYAMPIRDLAEYILLLLHDPEASLPRSPS